MLPSPMDSTHVHSGSKSDQRKIAKTMLEILASHANSNFHFLFLFTGDEPWLRDADMPIGPSRLNHPDTLSSKC
jgi:hypothetical protein